MDSIKIGALISARRKRQNMTQKDLSDMLGISNRAVSKWETGEGYPDISTLPALAEILNLSVDELLKGKAEETPSAAEPSVSILDEYMLESAEKQFENRYLISLSIIIFGIISSVLALKLYYGYYSSILYAVMIAIAFLSIGLKYYLNTFRLIKLRETKYNHTKKFDNPQYHKNYFKKHVLFFSLYLILAEFLVFVAPIYPFVCYNYYHVHGTIFGRFDLPLGKLAIDYGFCILFWVILYIVLLITGLVVMKKRLDKSNQ